MYLNKTLQNQIIWRLKTHKTLSLINNKKYIKYIESNLSKIYVIFKKKNYIFSINNSTMICFSKSKKKFFFFLNTTQKMYLNLFYDLCLFYLVQL